MPVESHPLSPADVPATSRNARQRVVRGSEIEPSRPITGYFELKSQSDERAASSVSSPVVEADSPNATVKPSQSRPRLNPFGSSLRSKSKSPDRKSVRSSRTPRASDADDQSSHVMPGHRHSRTITAFSRPYAISSGPAGPAADLGAVDDLVLSTKWHDSTDDELDVVVARINHSLPTPEPFQQTYKSVIRLLSKELQSLENLRAQLDRERNIEATRRRKIANMMQSLPHSEVAIVRNVLNILSSESFDETPVEGPQLISSDSLTEAIAEALTPLGAHSPTIIASGIPEEVGQDDTASIRSSIRSADRDGFEGASTRSRSTRRSRESRMRPPSVIEEWMGSWWKDKDKSSGSIKSGQSDTERSPSPSGDETERDKRAKKKASGGFRMLNSLGVPTSWIGSTSPSSTVSVPPHKKPDTKRKMSITVPTPVSAPDSPLTSHFRPAPAVVPPPTIAPEIPTPPEQSPTLSSRKSIGRKSMAASEITPPLPTEPHPSHIKAISYATRVMTTDPSSVLHDGGFNVSPLITNLAYTLVNNMKSDSDFILREGRLGLKMRTTPMQSPALNPPPSVDVPAPALAVAQIESKESRATIVSNLSRTLNNSMLAGVSRRTNPATLTGPLLSAFKSRTPSLLETGPKATQVATTISAMQPVVQQIPANGVAPKTGTVELDSIIPAFARPPTLYLSRTYSSSIANPTFRPSAFPTVPSRFSMRTAGSNGSLETQADRFGFLYDATLYDVQLLARAREAGNTAPACLTGVRIADREGDSDDEDSWHGQDKPSDKKKLPVMREPCSCEEGILSEAEATRDKIDKGGSTSQATETDRKEGDHVQSREGNISPVESEPQTPTRLDGKAKAADEPLKPQIPNHVCLTTVRVVLSELKTIHDARQTACQGDWDPFLRRIRRMKESSAKQGGGAQGVLVQASTGAAAFLGLSKPVEDKASEDDEASWTAGLGLAHLSTNKEQWKEFNRLFRAGIPLVYRSKVWFECSGALEISEPGTYRDLASRALVMAKENKSGQKNLTTEEIEKDVTRTMPLNIFFGGDGQGVDKLRSVLGAYSLRNPAVGYCQGMNLVASTLLLVLADQQEAFWVFSAIIEKILPPDFFSPSLLVSRACPMVLLDYVQDHLPKLFAHLAAVEIDLPAICFSWFLSLFTDCLPVETLFRVWDVLLCDKDGMDVLFRVSLAILKIGEEELLRCSSVSSVYSVLESLPTRMWDADRLLKVEGELRTTVLHDEILSRRAIHITALSERS